MLPRFPSSSRSTVPHGAEQGQHVFRGRGALDVVDRVEHEAAALVEDVDPLADLVVHLLRRAEGNRLLRVNPAAPEDHVPAEFFLQPHGIHFGGRALDRIQDVKAGFDEVRDQLVHRAAGMNERLPLRFGVDQGIHAFVEGLEQIPIRGFGNEGAALGSKVGAGNHGRVDQVAEQVDQRGDVLLGDLALPFEHGPHVVLAGHRRDVPLLNVADAFGVFQERRRNQGDVAERGAGHTQHVAAVRTLQQPVAHGAVVGQVFLAEQPELLQVVLRVQLVLVDRILANHGVEEVSARRHAAAGRRRRVAFGIDVRVAGFVLGDDEVAGDEHLGAVVQRERLPAAGHGAEQRLAAGDADDVDAQRGPQFVVHFAQHLVRLDHLDAVIALAEHRLAEPGHRG